MIKNAICTALGMAGSFIASCFGGWSAALTTLLIFMAIDYITGLVVAGIFHKSPKTATGGLESKAGLKGLFRKCFMLLFVLIGFRLDMVMGITYIRDAVCIGFIANELLSIVENAGLMGLPIPKVITNAIDILKRKSDSGGESGGDPGADQ